MTNLTHEQREKIRDIHARLQEIAPYQEDGSVTAAGLAKNFAMRAQIVWRQELGKVSEPTSMERLSLMASQFAAAHALAFFRQFAPQEADEVASQIRDAMEDGGGIGEWLWEHLGGEDCAEISRLADELVEVTR